MRTRTSTRIRSLPEILSEAVTDSSRFHLKC